jgi:hypothetical protein
MKEIKKYAKLWVVWQFIEAAVLLACGIVTVCFANNQDYYFVIGIVVGIVIIVDSSLRLAMHFLGSNNEDAGSLLAVVGELTLGILLVSAPSILMPIFTLFSGILLLAIAGVAVFDAIARLIGKKGKVAVPVVELIVAALLIVAGILIVVSYANNGKDATTIILILVGIILMVLALAEVIITIQMISDAKKAKKAIKETIQPKEEKK